MEESDLQAITQAGARIIRTVGMRIDGTDEFFEHLRAFGCEIKGIHVHFPARVVDEVMARMAEHRRTHPPEEGPVVPPTEVMWSTSGQALWCCDLKTDQLRPATKGDLADLCRVIDSVEGLDRTHPTFIPQDAPLKTREFHAFVTIILNSRKPHRVSAYSAEIIPYYYEALKVVCGSEGAARVMLQSLLPCKVWINSPFMIAREDVEASMGLRKLTGQPLVFSSMPVAGVATPVTIAGALTQMVAEVIGANILGLAVDNLLCGWCAGPLSFDMKAGIHTQWGPETVFLHAGAAQVASYLFGGTPSFHVPMTTAAKQPGAQSMMEKAFAMGMGFLAGARSFGGLTTLAFSDVGSAVQLMMELELVSCVRRMAAGFNVDPGRIGEAVIQEVAPRGAYYLNHDHTLAHFRDEQWFPELMDRRVPMAWNEDPQTMVDHARIKALRLIEKAPNQCPLAEDQRRDLQEILEAADRDIAAHG
jgi:trimethylamine--corrinoid protein Co-methyltransferase